MQPITIGIDIGGTKTALGLFSGPGMPRLRAAAPSPQNAEPEALVRLLVREIRGLLQRGGIREEQLTGIGVGAPAWVDYEAGRVIYAPNLACLKNYPLRDALAAHFSVPVYVDNDANLAALAEYKLGAGRGFSHMVYSTASTGIGGGLILNGALYRGAYGCAGEIGHMLATPGKGEFCGCGKQGCFESWAGGAHIFQHVARRLRKGETTCMTDLAGRVEDITGNTLREAFFAGDKMAQEILQDMANSIGILYYNLYQALNVSCFVMGGGLLTGFGDALLGRVRECFSALHSASPLPLPVEIRPAELTQDFGIIGANLLLYQ